MLTRSGRRCASTSSSADGRFGNAAATKRMTPSAPRTPRRAAALSRPQSITLSFVLLVHASAANATSGFVDAMTKSTWSNRFAIAWLARSRQFLGDRGRASGCTSTATAKRPPATSSVSQRRATRPVVAELGEQRGEVAHHPLRGEVRKVEVDVDPDHARRADQARRPRRGGGCSTAGSSVARHRATARSPPAGRRARACRGRASQRAGDRQARRVGRVRSRAHVVVARRVPHRAREVAEHDGVGAHVRVRASGGCGRTCPSSRAGRCTPRGCGSSRRRRRRSRG